MSDEYTPTTKEVRESFYIHTFNRDMEHLRAEAFDRWLAAHDAEIHREGYSDAICHIYPTAADDAEILDQFMDSYKTPTRYQAKDGAQ